MDGVNVVLRSASMDIYLLQELVALLQELVALRQELVALLQELFIMYIGGAKLLRRPAPIILSAPIQMRQQYS